MNIKQRLISAAQRRGTAFPRMLAFLVAIIVMTMVVTFFVMTLLINIFERKQEARNPFYRVVELDDTTEDPALWGKNFPQQYDAYLRTVDQIRTKYGGNEAVQRTPTNVDPRSVLARSRLESDPRLRKIWAGYAFAVDFREERGHAYMLDDQTYTERQRVVKQPGTCMHCHASVYVPYKKLGNGDLIKGFEKMNRMPYFEARKLVTHPVACIDCHDPKNMQLRITRPGFLEGIRVYRESQGIRNYDVNTMATRQEMRSFVCGQCHVEYYFKGQEKRLTYPWFKGLQADQILAYYDEIGFKDWAHSETGAPMLKVQHPEFETWKQGIHSRAGVACADCHMPYKRVGALKISDHHVSSPLLPGNITNACQTCHRVPESELKARAEAIQDRVFEMRNVAMDALVEFIGEIKAARIAGATDNQLMVPGKLQRKAQFLLDFVESENSMGFHAPQESERLLFLSLNYTRQGQKAIRALGLALPAPTFGAMPAMLSSMEKR